MGRRHVSTTVYLDADQVDKLRQLQAVTKVPTAERVREGIDLVLEYHERIARVISPREDANGPTDG